jgi:hypothetical protein
MARFPTWNPKRREHQHWTLLADSVALVRLVKPDLLRARRVRVRVCTSRA